MIEPRPSFPTPVSRGRRGRSAQATRARPAGWARPLLLLVVLCSLSGAPVTAVRASGSRQDPADRAEPPATGAVAPDPMQLCREERYDELLAIASRSLPDPAVERGRKLDILRAQACMHLIRFAEQSGGDECAHAVEAMRTMLRLDADTDFVPGWRYPPVAHALFREVRRAISAAPAADPQKPDRLSMASPLRVAVGPTFLYLDPFVTTRKYNYQAYAQALRHMIASDLNSMPHIVLLGREHMEQLEGELALARKVEFVSQENRLRLRQLLSAASFVYGDLYVAGEDEVTLALTWARTETMTDILSVQETRRVRRGRDLQQLYRAVMEKQFLPAMQESLAAYVGAGRGAPLPPRATAPLADDDRFLHYLGSVAAAIAAEESGDIAGARAGWQAARDVLPADMAAAERLQTLQLPPEVTRGGTAKTCWKSEEGGDGR
jgi:hypothetical protein